MGFNNQENEEDENGNVPELDIPKEQPIEISDNNQEASAPDLSSLATQLQNTPPTVQPTGIGNKYQDLLNQFSKLKGAQAERQQGLANAGYLAAASQLSQAMGAKYGAKLGDNEQGVKAVQDMASLPVQNIKENIATAKESLGAEKLAREGAEFEKKADPNSDISKLTRAQAYSALNKIDPDNKMGLQGKLDGMSAADLEKSPIIKGLYSKLSNNAGILGYGLFVNSKNGHPVEKNKLDGKMYDSLTGELVPQDAVLVTPKPRIDPVTGAMGGYNAGVGMVVPGGSAPIGTPQPQVPGQPAQPPELLDKDLNKKYPKIYQDNFVPIRNNFDKDIAPLRDSQAAATNIFTKLNMGDPNMKVDSGLSKALAVQSAKISQGGGQIAEQVINDFAGAGGIAPRLDRYIGKQVGDMTPEDKKFFSDFATKMSQAAKQDLENRADRYVSQVTQLPIKEKITPENARKLLLVDKQLTSTAPQKYQENATGNKSGEIKRKTDDGKIAIFDSKTKKFLRYEQ